ncbi:MAG: DUF2000 domain-containing protein [Coleofasciculaceae cyanobacterium RL_1_1]|nr:DUF2000 domain-containing protein [Coleofasciculaceae cyanobacterium RL_1_1]
MGSAWGFGLCGFLLLLLSYTITLHLYRLRKRLKSIEEAISIGAYSDPNIMGRRNLTDKSGINHAGISKYPFIITKVKQGRLKRLVDEARQMKELLLWRFYCSCDIHKSTQL